MLRLGSNLLFITFTQLIAVILYTESRPGVGKQYVFANIHPLIYLIILVELVYSVYLIYKGYCKFYKEV